MNSITWHSRKDRSTSDSKKTLVAPNLRDSEGEMTGETQDFLELEKYSVYDNLSILYPHVKNHRTTEHEA